MIAGNIKKEDIMPERDVCDCGGIFVKISECSISSMDKLFEIDQMCYNCGTTRKSKK